MSKLIKTLIVDDSAIVRAMLRQVLSNDDRFEFAGEAGNGEKAVAQNEALKPDLIIMDYNMPVMNGLEASRAIFESSDHLPAIVTFTTETDKSIKDDFLKAGILAYFQKPNLAKMNTTELKKFRDSLVDVYYKRKSDVIPSGNFFKKLSENKSEENETLTPIDLKQTELLQSRDFKILVIGASTGGPEALKKVLSDIGPNFPLPILITQHIDSLFDKQLAQWLSAVSKVQVQLAKDGRTAREGIVYLAPADNHLVISKSEDGAESCLLNLSSAPPLHFLRPAVDVMFKSARTSFAEKCIAVLLTGMGTDGAEELLKLKEAGAYTICESEETCVVYGMPKAAVDSGAACKVLPLNEIGKTIKGMVRHKS